MHLLVPDAIRRGRFKESYSFLVMLFFLYHLSENHDFSVDFAHPIDSRLAAFLQSTGSVECLVKGGKLRVPRAMQRQRTPKRAQTRTQASTPKRGATRQERGKGPYRTQPRGAAKVSAHKRTQAHHGADSNAFLSGHMRSHSQQHRQSVDVKNDAADSQHGATVNAGGAHAAQTHPQAPARPSYRRRSVCMGSIVNAHTSAANSVSGASTTGTDTEARPSRPEAELQSSTHRPTEHKRRDGKSRYTEQSLHTSASPRRRSICLGEPARLRGKSPRLLSHPHSHNDTGTGTGTGADAGANTKTGARVRGVVHSRSTGDGGGNNSGVSNCSSNDDKAAHFRHSSTVGTVITSACAQSPSAVHAHADMSCQTVIQGSMIDQLLTTNKQQKDEIQVVRYTTHVRLHTYVHS